MREEGSMIFVGLGKFRRKPTREGVAQFDRLWKELEKEGVKRVAVYWTLGRYDTIAIIEAPDEKTAMKASLKFSDAVALETLTAVNREEAIRLVD
jgi:uncharacterized protein with GYD domain